MRDLTALAMLMGLGAVHSTATAANDCSIDMYKRADTSLESAASDWGSRLRHQETFVSCDDGALAEGYSDAVVSLLAHQWDRFDVFVTLSERRPAFREWAIRHIEATASIGDLEQVVRNATRCTGSAKTRVLCGQVGKAAREALND